MDGFLDAECVMGALFDKGILTKKDWKLNKITASSYDVNFEFADSARIAGFVIYIKGTYHCVGTTALVNQAKRFNFQADSIISLCKI